MQFTPVQLRVYRGIVVRDSYFICAVLNAVKGLKFVQAKPRADNRASVKFNRGRESLQWSVNESAQLSIALDGSFLVDAVKSKFEPILGLSYRKGEWIGNRYAFRRPIYHQHKYVGRACNYFQ